MKKENIYVQIDSRNRLTIPKKIFSKKGKELSQVYKIYELNGKIILEPVKEIPKEEQWLFDPKNKALVDEIKRALKQKADRDIDLDSLEQD